MIVTSLRCYLNILTQIMPKEELLKAQYYICDTVDKSKHVSTEDMVYNVETGQYEYRSGIQTIATTASEYCLKYTESNVTLNISKYLTDFDIDIDKFCNSKNPVDRFNYVIHKEEFVMAFYNEFIEHIKADKLVIMIFMDEQSVSLIGHDVCEYLSNIFGQDVTFIDPQYRPNVRGRVSYVGDKVAAEKNVKFIREKSAAIGFVNAITQSNYGECANNITSFLSYYETFEELIWLHDLLWPDNPLPADHYTISDIKQIIISKGIDESMAISADAKRKNNMATVNQNFMWNR